MAFLNMVHGYLNSAMGQASMIGIVIEFILRLLPSQKPMSILYAVGAGAKSLGNIFSKLGELLDKVLPQNLK